MHDWSDEDFDWRALEEACTYLETNCKRWARLGIWTKEKWGTMRVSTTCAFFTRDCPIHQFFKPGHVYYRWPRWFRRNIDRPVGKFLERIKVLPMLRWYQFKVLTFFWKRAAKKWPHIRKEILADYETLINS